MRTPTPLALGCLLFAAACAAPRPVEEVLAPAREAGAADPPAGPQATAGHLQAELDRSASALRAAALAPGADAAACVDAARALFLAAELRYQRAVLAALDAAPDEALAELLEADARVPDAAREPIRSLCAAGRELAERAVALDPERADARLYAALHLSLLAWCEGPMTALVRDRGPAIVRAVEAAVALDPDLEGASPLRLEGRFRDQAPWPYRDRARARAALEQAAAAAPSPINLLFLGDALAAAGAPEEARAAWHEALTAEPDATTRPVAAFHREQARRRLAAEPVPGG